MDIVGDYQYDKKDIIGHGAFAMVFKGCRKQDPTYPVAIKYIKKKELNKSKELLAKEIKVLRELSVYQHENLVQLLHVKETDSSVYLVLEFCNGGDLCDYLLSKGTMSEDAISSFMQQIASALKALYDKGIMHRDIKPQNILICIPKGGSKMTTPPTQLKFKIADFGFARFLEDGKMAGTLCGSPCPRGDHVPEVRLQGRPLECGHIVFQCLTNKAPFLASTPHQLRDFYHSHVDSNPEKKPRESSFRLEPPGGGHPARHPWNQYTFARAPPTSRRATGCICVARGLGSGTIQGGSSFTDMERNRFIYRLPRTLRPPSTPEEVLGGRHPYVIAARLTRPPPIFSGMPLLKRCGSSPGLGVPLNPSSGGGSRFTAPGIPENTSPELRDMLLRLLTRDPTRRIGIKELLEHPFLKKFRRSPSKRGHSSSPIPARRHTPSLSSESSSPGSIREISPLARQVGEVGDMVNTLTGSNEEDSGFTKVEKPDTRPHTPDDFVLVPESLPEYNSSGERRGKADRAPLALAEEEYDAFDESLTSSLQPVRMHANEGKVTFRKDELQRLPSPSSGSHLSSPVSPSPSPPLSQRSGGSSAPIPVPSLSRMSGVAPREGGCGKSGSPARIKKRSASSGSSDRSGDRLTGRRNSETALAAPDITQVSPPAVQFNIGTPPNTGTWKRTNSIGTGSGSVPSAPVLAGSPLRRSASCSPGTCFSPHHPYGNSPSPVPAVTAPSSRHCLCHHHPPPPHHQLHHHLHHHHHHPAHDPYVYHDTKFHRYPTVPDCTALVAYASPEERGLEACHRCGTEPDLRSQPFCANHFLRTAYQQPAALPGLGALLPWSGSREQLTSLGSEVDRGSPLEPERSATPILQRRNSLMGEVPSPSSRMYTPTTTPPSLEALPCGPPELCEDTLMDDEHNQTMARLRFILDVVDCVVALAHSRGSAYNLMAESLSVRNKGDALPPPRQPLKQGDSQRLMEQLMLYLRALQMIDQSITLAEKEMKLDRLQFVSSLRKVLVQQNKLYMHCIKECRKIHQQLGSACTAPLTPNMILNTANRLIYSYAVEQCQTAVMDELEGNKKESFQRYTTAQILLHSLAQMASKDYDRQLLENYRHSVEVRLSGIGGQGVQRACPAWS
ncbi:serine/threonine-protein kinase unc-51-like [Babylonia areolata]|uniref:serine/threonine-protein kinase unc-51-like n=1 Tax=Babylonia areolata TaxID=304850 RepID=UPI003FD49F79